MNNLYIFLFLKAEMRCGIEAMKGPQCIEEKKDNSV